MTRGPDPLRLLVVIAVTAAIGVKALFWLQDEGARRPRPGSLRGTASVAGFVVDDEGRPVPAARVRGYVPGDDAYYHATAVTGDDGAFALRDVPSGQLQLSTEREGYLRQFAGYPAETFLEIDAGESLAGVSLRLSRGGAISGRVVDERGAPVAQRMVRAFQRVQRIDGSFDVRGLPGTGTDAAGAYRIAGLPPGEYYVMASLASDAADSVYHPGALTLDEAARIAVAGTGEVRGIDIRGRHVPRSSVDGRVTGIAAGRTVRVSLVSARSHASSRRRSVIPNADMTFRFDEVPAGRYWLVAHPENGTDGGWALAEVAVGDRDVAAPALAVGRGTPLTARVAIEDAEGDARFEPGRLLVTGADERSAAMLSTGHSTRAEALSASTVTFGSLPAGTYRLVVRPHDGLWPRAIEIDGESRPDGLLRIDPGDAPPRIVVTLTGQPSRMRGELRTPSDAPAAGYLVIAFSADPSRWSLAPTVFGIDRTGDDGRFTMHGLVPGDYLVAVVRGEPAIGAAQLEALRSTATPVTVPDRPTEAVVRLRVPAGR